MACLSCTAVLGVQLGPIGAQRPVRAPGRAQVPAVRPLHPRRRRAAAASAASRAVAGQQGMTVEAFNKLVASSPAVLIDFYTTWWVKRSIFCMAASCSHERADACKPPASQRLRCCCWLPAAGAGPARCWKRT